MAATQILEIGGKNYTLTIVPEHGERGLELPEIFSLLPTILSMVQKVTSEINKAKDGQGIAVTVANCIQLTLSFLWELLNLADLPADAKKVTDKIIKYANYFASGVVAIEAPKG
jgi:hypothetical protein